MSFFFLFDSKLGFCVPVFDFGHLSDFDVDFMSLCVVVVKHLGWYQKFCSFNPHNSVSSTFMIVLLSKTIFSRVSVPEISVL